jgi:hypothetical protein
MDPDATGPAPVGYPSTIPCPPPSDAEIVTSTELDATNFAEFNFDD